MRGLMKGVVVRELGQVILKPGDELMPMFGDRVLVATVPPEFSNMPIGPLPAVRQQLASDPRFSAFFMHERVLNAAGGPRALQEWVGNGSGCQWTLGDGYHDKNSGVHVYGRLAVRLCWHHQHKFRDHILPDLDSLAAQNVADFVVYRARLHFRFDESHQLTLPELCWWAWVMELTDLIPEDVAAASLRMRPYTMPAGVKREADIDHTPAARQIVAEKAKKAAKVLAIDPVPPKSFFKLPKRERWESKAYLQWVKSQLCVIRGIQADDAHHIIGYGQGGMGTKAHDLFTIPLCREEHDALHRDPSRWEAEHGSQIELWFRFIDHSLSIGAIS